MEPPGLLVVDAANVVGSVPDGWWRDRAGATERLRDRLVAVARDGLPGFPPPVEVVLVVEGAARAVASAPGVHVVRADGSGDDAIVALLRRESGHPPAGGPAGTDPLTGDGPRDPGRAGTGDPGRAGPGFAGGAGPSDPGGAGPTRSVGRRLAVVTADRGLRSRVATLGAQVLGPRAVRG